MAKKKKKDEWENDKVFQSKVSNGKQYNTSGKSAYDLFLEDQNKRQKESEQGKVRYTEAAKASRVQYSLPGYQGKSQNQGKTYNWERDTMQNTKVKGAGNSYTKKYDALTKSMGMTPGQAEEFRKYMDFQEDSQHVDPKMNKDGKINQSQSLKYARDARMQTDVVDGILDNMFKTTQEKVKKAKEVPFKKVTGWDKLKKALGIDLSDEKMNTLQAKELGVEPHYGGKKDKTDPVLKSQWEDLKSTKQREDMEKPLEERDGIYGLLDRFVLPVSQGASNVILPGNEDVQIQNDLAEDGTIDNPATRAGMIDRGLETKILRGAGTMAGYLAPYGQGYKAVNAALNLPKLAKAAQFVEKSPYLGRAAVGGAAGLTAEAGLAATNELANPEAADMSDYALRTLIGAAGGAVGDPLIHGAGQLMKGGLGQFAKVNGDIPEFTGQVSDNVLDSLAPNVARDKTLGGNIASPSDDIFDKLLAQKAPKEESVVAGNLRNPNGNSEAEDDWIRRLLGQEGTPQPAPKTSEPIVNNSQAPEQVLESLVRPETARTMNDFVPNESPLVNTPGVLNETPRPKQPYEMSKQEFEAIQSNGEYVGNSPSPKEAEAWRHDPDNESYLLTNENAKQDGYGVGTKYEVPEPKGDTVTVYRTVPEGVDIIKPGDYVSTSKKYVEDYLDHGWKRDRDHTPPAKILKAEIPKDELMVLAANEVTWTPKDAYSSMMELAQKQGKLAPKELGSPNTSSLDEMLNFLSSGQKQPSDKGLDQLVQNEVPKANTEVTTNNPAPASDVPTPGADDKLLMNLNLQRHTDGNPQLVDTVGTADSEKAITKQSDKFYEKYVNSNHSAKVAEEKVLEGAIKRAQELGKSKTAEKLKQELKKTKKYGSDFEKAIGNERATAAASTNFLKRHFKALDQTVKNDEEMAQFLNYQMAMDLKWRKENGMSKYELPDGVDWGAIDDMVSEASRNTKFGQFNSEMRNLTQEWRDVMLEYGLINKEAHAALSKNPHYMYLGKELSHKQNNIQRGTNYRKVSDKRASGPNIVHAQTGGDAQSLFKNPVEGLINNTFSVFKNAYKEETGRQALRMAKLDKNKMFAWEISEKAFKEHGGIKVSNGGKPRYVALQDDLMDVLKENEAGLDLGVFSDLTSAFAGLKTRSLEYQTAALIRDTGTSMVTSQVNNPLRYFKEYVRSMKNGSKDAKKIGGIFENAHNAQTAGLDPNKVLKEFQRKHGNVTSFNPKKPEDWKGLARTVGRILDTPFKYTSKLLGQVSDEIPRDIEVRETERLFMKQHGKKIENIKNRLAQVDEQLRASEGATDPFDPALQGIDKLKGQKDKLELMLQRLNQDLKREQVYRSRDVINYSRAGRGKLAKGIRKYMIFANTTTQSKDKMIRSFIERPGATIAKAAVAMAPLVAAQKLMFNTLGDEDKDIYERVPSYIKMNNFVFVDKGNVYTVPKIQELALVTNPIEAVLHGEKLNDVAKYITKETVPYQAGNIAQGLVPDEKGNTLFDADPMTKNMMGVTMPSFLGTPAADVAMNDKTGFNRKPISYKSDEANKWTLDVFKKLAGDNVNADRVEYLFRQYFGDAGKYSSYAADYALDPSNTDKLDEMLRNLNPLQDRIYRNDSRFFKSPILDKKK